MLPNLKTTEEKREYAKKLYSLFTKDPRVSRILANPAKEGEQPTISAKNWPTDMVKAELKRTRKMTPHVDFDTKRGLPLFEAMTWYVGNAETLLNSLEKAADPQTTEQDLEKSMREIDECIHKFGKNSWYPPHYTMERYRVGYDKSNTGSPIMDFFEGMTQTLDNIMLTNEMLLDEPEAISAERQEQFARVYQNEIDQEENELAELCAENNIPHDQIQSAYESSCREALDAKSRLDNKIKESAELTKQVQGLDAVKLLDEIGNLEKDKIGLTQESEKLARETKALEIGQSQETNKKLKELSGKRTRLNTAQEDLNKRNETSKRLVEEATTKKNNIQNQLDVHYVQHPELKKLDDEYDGLTHIKDGLKGSVAQLRKGFEHLGDRNTKINDFLQGKIGADELSGVQKGAVDIYNKVKEELAEVLKDDLEDGELTRIFEQAEKSNMNVGWALLSEDSPLQEYLQDVEQEMEDMKAKNPAFREELALNKAYNQQMDIIEEENTALDNRKAEQQTLDEAQKTLTEEEQNFKRNFAEIMAKNHAFPKKETIEQFMKSSPSEAVKKVNRAARQKKMEHTVAKGKLENTANALKSKRELAGKIKLSKDSIPELKTLRADAESKANREETLKSMQDKQLNITDKLAARERMIREMKAANVVGKEISKRARFNDTLKALRKQVPNIKGEKNSKSYDKMRDDLTDLTDKMNNSNFTAQQRAEAFGKLKESAQKYLEEKDAQWRPFPSQKRLDRLKAARDIVSFCENSQKLYQETPGLHPETLHEAALQNPQANPEKVAQQKFKEQMQPKVEAANNNRQKQVNEPALQESKQQEQPKVEANVSALN